MDDIQKVVDQVGDDYVLSVKPSPAIFAGGNASAETALAISSVLVSRYSVSGMWSLED